MTKEEINKKIFTLQTEEEILNFVKDRIKELENDSVETTVGQNYTTTFKEYISDKTHYKPAAKLKDQDCPDLVYDDINPYVELIKAIKNSPWYNEMTLFSTIFFTIYDYLPNTDGMGFDRAWTYMSNSEKRVSIKTIKENECAFCSEKSGMAHNMFKFLGVDSEVAIGYRNSERHAYNIIYPNGYNNEPMVIYDPSHFVNFIKGGQKLSFGYFKALRKEDYEKLVAGRPIKIDLSKTEQNYRQLYGLNEDYNFEGESAIYMLGLNRKKEDQGDNLMDEVISSSNFENGDKKTSEKK